MTKKELALFEKRKARIIKMLKIGLTQAAIARRLSVSRQRINQIIRSK